MKIENAKNLLIAIKDQIAKNLSEDDSLQFTKEFDLLIDNCDASKTYAKFCIKLLERAKLNVSSDKKQILLAVSNVINLFKNNGIREELKKASAAAYAAAFSAYASYTAYYASTSASAATTAAAAFYAAYAAAYAAAYVATSVAYAASASASAASAAADAAKAANGSSDCHTEYKQQSIDLLQVLKTKAGRPAGSKNFIKKEKYENRKR